MRQIRYWGSYIGMTCGLTLLSSLFMTALSLLRGGMAELALTGIGMFVATGAKAQIRGKRREQFYDNYVKSLMAEAMSLGIT